MSASRQRAGAMYALYVGLICRPYMHDMYALCVCLMPAARRCYVCLTCMICMPHVYALRVCLMCMPYMYAIYTQVTKWAALAVACALMVDTVRQDALALDQVSLEL